MTRHRPSRACPPVLVQRHEEYGSLSGEQALVRRTGARAPRPVAERSKGRLSNLVPVGRPAEELPLDTPRRSDGWRFAASTADGRLVRQFGKPFAQLSNEVGFVLRGKENKIVDVTTEALALLQRRDQVGEIDGALQTSG